MDFPSLYIALFFTILLFFLSRKNKGKWATTQNPSPKLPPGPWKLPIIGNIHNLLGSQPHHNLAKLALKYGPLMHLRLGEVSTIVVSSPRVSKEILKTHDLCFASRPQLVALKKFSYEYTTMAFAPYGQYWRQLRKLCVVELLSSKRVEMLRPVREEETAKLMQSIHKSSHSLVNLTQLISQLTNDVIAIAMAGKGCKNKELFISFVDEATKLAGGFFLAEYFPTLKFLPIITGLKFRLERSQRKLDTVLDSMIEERRRERAIKDRASDSEDLMDVLLGLQQDSNLELPITTENIKAILVDMYAGGSGTSSTLLGWAMSELIRNPRVMRKAQEEARQTLKGKSKVTEADVAQLQYLQLVIKEALRLHPPAPFLVPRESSEPIQIDGYDIPIKTRVIINEWAIGRNPQYWDDPEIFKPERFDGNPIDYKGNDFEFIPFGAGRRICPGMTLGIANVTLPLAQLIYYFDWELPGALNGECLDMTEEFGIGTVRKHDLCLIPVPRIPLPSNA